MSSGKLETDSLRRALQTLLKFRQLSRQQLKVRFYLLRQLFPVEPHCRMITGEVLPSFVLDNLAARLLHTFDSKHLLYRDAAQQHDQFWIQQSHLFKQVKVRARFQFGCFG